MLRSPSWSLTWSVLRIVMAAVIIAAIVAQLIASVTRTADSGGDVGTVVVNFFSFFTILSNLIAAIVLVWAAGSFWRRRPGEPESTALATVLACASTYMVITGIVYNTLLRQIVLEQGSLPVPWSNEVLHLIGPLFLFIDVFVGPGRRALRWSATGAVLAFPIAWVAYTLVRGPLVTNPASGDAWWYPYPFLNPHNPGGWPSVVIYVVAISVAFIVVGAGIVWVGRKRGRHRP